MNSAIITALVIVLARFLTTQANYLLFASGTGINEYILVEVTETGTVSTLGRLPITNTTAPLFSQYSTSNHAYYTCYDTKYLFTYDLTDPSTNQSVYLQVPTTAQPLSVLCVSQQLGTLYSVMVTGPTAVLVQITPGTGALVKAAAPYTLADGGNAIEQCVVDDANSRVVWTYSSTTNYYLVATDTLPNDDGGTTLLGSIASLQMWLYYDYTTPAFYAATIVAGDLQVYLLTVAIDALQWTTLGNIQGFDFDYTQGALNAKTEVIAIFNPTSLIQVGTVNVSAKSVNLAWNGLDSITTVYVTTTAWLP